jgi:hypothetical protein
MPMRLIFLAISQHYQTLHGFLSSQAVHLDSETVHSTSICRGIQKMLSKAMMLIL